MGRSRAVERRCRALLRAVGLPDPLDVHELCRRVGAARERPILLAGLPISAAGFCGLWLAAANADYIFYEANTSVHHQEHIILHELGHILFEHRGCAAPADMFPQLDEGAVRIMLARRHEAFSDRKEMEAETFAYVVQAWADSRARPPDEDGDGDGDGLDARLSRVLED